MQIDFYCPRWGSEHVGWPQFAAQVKQAGFVGVEVFPLGDKPNNTDMVEVLSDAGLSYILLHAELQEGNDFNRYKQALERNLYALLDYQNRYAKPQFIVSQTGREYYSRAQMAECFAICDRISRESSVRIIQETHRNKWSFAAHVVKDYLERFPDLELALDFPTGSAFRKAIWKTRTMRLIWPSSTAGTCMPAWAFPRDHKLPTHGLPKTKSH